jgi:hypothetical protein
VLKNFQGRYFSSALREQVRHEQEKKNLISAQGLADIFQSFWRKINASVVYLYCLRWENIHSREVNDPENSMGSGGLIWKKT